MANKIIICYLTQTTVIITYGFFRKNSLPKVHLPNLHSTK